LTILTWSFALLCLGAAIATLVRSQGELSASVDIGGALCTVLAGALVPLSDMPAWARHLGPISPGYWAVRGLHGALAGQPAVALSSSAVLAAVAVLGAAVAAYRLSHGWSRPH
jgi:ABC-2 type transport system permease protein